MEPTVDEYNARIAKLEEVARRLESVHEEFIASQEEKPDNKEDKKLTAEEGADLCVTQLMHARICRGRCGKAACVAFSKAIAHTYECRKKCVFITACKQCRSLTHVLVHHCKRCDMESCDVPYCHYFRAKRDGQILCCIPFPEGGPALYI